MFHIKENPCIFLFNKINFIPNNIYVDCIIYSITHKNFWYNVPLEIINFLLS